MKNLNISLKNLKINVEKKEYIKFKACENLCKFKY